MVEATLVFGFYLLIAALVMLLFWAVQVRFGDISDLDPKGFMVKLLRSRNVAAADKIEVPVRQALNIAPTDVLDNRVYVDVHPSSETNNTVWVNPSLGSPAVFVGLGVHVPQHADYQKIADFVLEETEASARRQLKEEVIAEVLAVVRRELDARRDEHFWKAMSEIALDSLTGIADPALKPEKAGKDPDIRISFRDKEVATDEAVLRAN